uniref:AAA+ ATPase domain-containing protein n=1 Tax=viral metagenome TaxID=1070528 RepID=A0A6C0D2W4_9ZZZZ
MNIITRILYSLFIFNSFLSSESRRPTEKNGFDAIAGYPEVKKELLHMAHFMTHPQDYREWNVRLPSGCLLYGPPGTGKTLLARSFAHHISSQLGFNITYMVTSGSDFQEKYVGVGSARIRELFALARKMAPTIIYIDEIDSIGRKRSSEESSGGKDRDSTLNALLVEMDGFFSKEFPVFVIASTNRKELLDEALLRPGRLDKLIHVPLPSYQTRLEILYLHSDQKPFSLNNKKDILEKIAKITHGFSGAELENVLNQATLSWIQNQRDDSFSFHDLENVVLQIAYGASAEDREQQEQVLQNTPYDTLYAIAVHELGHLYTSFYCPYHSPAIEVSITRPSPHTLGYTRFDWDEKEGHVLSNVNHLLDTIRTLMGGRIAESLVLGTLNMTTGASGDWKRIDQLLYTMITVYGFSFSFPGNEKEKENPQGSTTSSSISSIHVESRLPSLLSESSKTRVHDMMDHLFQLQWNWVLHHLSLHMDEISYQAHQLVKDRTWKKETIDEKKKDLFCIKKK